MSVQEQAVQMIQDLSDDNAVYLIDFMKRFMLPENIEKKPVYTEDVTEFMQEMEHMRVRAKGYFPSDFDPKKIWEEAVIPAITPANFCKLMEIRIGTEADHE